MLKSEQERSQLDAEIKIILKEVDQLESEIKQATVQGSDKDIERLKKLTEEKLINFKNLLNKKSALYSELLTNARVLMDINDQMILNEEEKLKLLEEIDVNTIELVQKRQMVAQMTSSLAEKKANYKGLKREIKMLDDRATFLKQTLIDKEDELDQIRELTSFKDLELEQLLKDTGSVAPDFSDPKRKNQKKKTKLLYRPIIGELVDETIAGHINETGCELPISRLVDGFYLFGTIKIFVKMLQGKLVARFAGVY